jgi:hypothetical protein
MDIIPDSEEIITLNLDDNTILPVMLD